MTSTKGGAGRGQGRRRIKPGEDSIVVTVRLTAGQKAKLAALGGAAWVRARIDEAPIGPGRAS